MKVYERKSFPRTARDLKVMYEKGNLSFDNAVQRSFVWKNTEKDNRMSMLIDSMMRGFPIPAMYCNCIFDDVKNKIYDFLDGKQRTTTIIKFLKDEFSLVNIPTFENEAGEEQDFNGLVFSQLPEDIQDTIKTYSLTVYYYENMEQEDVEEMFKRLNNGKSLAAIELTRVNAPSSKKVRTLATHEIFKIALSEKSISSYTNEDIVIKTWILLYGDKKSFEIKNVRPVFKSAIINDEQVEEMKRIYDVITDIYNEIKDNNKIVKKIFNKTQMISLTWIINKMIHEEIDLDTMKNWILDFYGTNNKDISISEVYNLNSKGREAVTEKAVRTRMQIMENHYDEYSGLPE